MAETPRNPRSGLLRRAVATLIIAGLVATSWTRVLDETALTETGATFTRALAAFAVARALNGVISAAQGTELAVQPVGVGVTLTVGEVLDPLNDLVESFAWLALLASVSLGTQMLLADVVSNAWVSAVLSLAAAAYVAALWWPGAANARLVLLRLFTLAVFARFLFALITLATGWVDQAVLADRQEAALERIELTQERIEDLQETPSQALPPDTESSILERLGDLIDDQRQALDIRAQLAALTDRVEGAIEQMVNLLVVFTVQTIIVPVAALLLAYWSFLWLWRHPWRDRAER